MYENHAPQSSPGSSTHAIRTPSGSSRGSPDARRRSCSARLPALVTTVTSATPASSRAAAATIGAIPPPA